MTSGEKPDTEIALSRLYERDIDVMLHEELLFNTQVQALMASQCGFSAPTAVRRCELSVVGVAGETDVLATFSCNTETIAVLIENKVDAHFQPRQPERYRERAEAMVAQGQCDRAFTVLLAPQNYSPEGDPIAGLFDARIAYEDLADAIGNDGSQRSKHRASLVRQAVSTAKPQATVSAEASAVWRRIYDIARVRFPDLQMKPPGQKGSGGYWIQFKAGLPSNIVVDWKMTQANVDLSFWPGAPHRPSPDIDLSGFARPTYLAEAGSQTVVRTQTILPQPHWTAVKDSEIEDALQAASDLLKFYWGNQNQMI